MACSCTKSTSMAVARVAVMIGPLAQKERLTPGKMRTSVAKSCI